MADDAQGGPTCHPVAPENELPEDAATRAARKELKQSSISDQSSKDEQAAAAVELNHSDTLDLDGSKGEIDEPREQVSSPKKKRGHDQLDGDRDMQDNGNASISPADSASARAARLQPEKKRHRDEDTTESHAVRLQFMPCKSSFRIGTSRLLTSLFSFSSQECPKVPSRDQPSRIPRAKAGVLASLHKKLQQSHLLLLASESLPLGPRASLL